MKKTNYLLFNFPELYLTILILLIGYSPPFSFNPMLIGLAFIPILLLVYKNKVAGIFIGIIFMLINLYMLGALISEFNEFTEFNSPAKQLLFIGLLFWTVNMISSVAMILKYSKDKVECNPLIDLSYAD